MLGPAGLSILNSYCHLNDSNGDRNSKTRQTTYSYTFTEVQFLLLPTLHRQCEAFGIAVGQPLPGIPNGQADWTMDRQTPHFYY